MAVRWALVLAAGLGTRLRPLTYGRAKAALPLAGVPLIRRQLAWLAAAGVTDVVINLHHRPESLTRLVGDGGDFRLRVRYSWEPVVLGTAGGPRHALPLLDTSSFFLVNGDTLTDVPLAELASAHRASGALVTLAVVPHPDRRRYGAIAADPAGVVQGFSPPGGPDPGWHFVGVQVVEAVVFEELPDGQPAATIPDLYGALAQRAPGSVRVYPVAASWYEIGTPREYLAACLAVARAEGHDEPPPGAGARLDPSARLVRTVVWDDVTIGPRCRLTECIVTDGASVPADTHLEGRILLDAANSPPGIGEPCGPHLVAVPF